ncbi:ParB/RepB/Spo0J family partition protein [Roseobacter sinensis]|uniref:ParB N-terminal domain-containing protein n=1 Tax=Roseobacter sinensis TaxID=2931391 RepID=A0ABT3BJP5_9RHOB|nr:ParB N-terminal domain-containing protein [Roseobacter sp. WL0113]MCV3273795.1 ParB N-terminal domain-containing protein [Roseobacter sp. WL0113]
MAKRKRLIVPERSGAQEPPVARLGSETRPWPGADPAEAAPGRAPIAQVAGDAAAQSALEDLAAEMHRARRDGRLVQALPLDRVCEDHMVRDRIEVAADDMAALKASIQARGQQTPIEVIALNDGTYGLISGWRRLQALRALHAETGLPEFATISALIKTLETVSDSYVAMVEENEIRVGLSYYERAHLVCAAVKLGVYATASEAIQTLFANGSAAKRSKIGVFVRLHDAFGTALRFPTAIPERLGLALAAALEADAAFGPRVRDMLRKTPAADAAAERSALERQLKKRTPTKKTSGVEVAPGITAQLNNGRAVLAGTGVDARFLDDLRTWVAQRQAPDA